MPTYRLRRLMQLANGNGGTAVDSLPIEAIDMSAAIADARSRLAVPQGFVLTRSMLLAATGVVLWSATGLPDPCLHPAVAAG